MLRCCCLFGGRNATTAGAYEVVSCTFAFLMHENVIRDSSLLQPVLCLDQERSLAGASAQPRPRAPAARLIQVSRCGTSARDRERRTKKWFPMFGNPVYGATCGRVPWKASLASHRGLHGVGRLA